MESGKLKVKGIILDLDGTIVDSREAYLEAAKTAFAKMGQKRVNRTIVIEIPRRLEQSLSIHDLIEGMDTRKFLEAYINAYYQTTATKTKPIPNISDTLAKLSEKAKLALVTMRFVHKREIIDELESFGLAKYFKYVITAMDTHLPKPSPEALKKCARQLSAKAYECVIVGDSVADVKAGKIAGTKTVAVLSGIFSRRELEMERPDLILESVNQLPDFLE